MGSGITAECPGTKQSRKATQLWQVREAEESLPRAHLGICKGYGLDADTRDEAYAKLGGLVQPELREFPLSDSQRDSLYHGNGGAHQSLLRP